MARRGENIRLRVDGRWEARAIITLPGSNKRTYKYFYGRSYPEVKQKRADFARECAIAALNAPTSLPISASSMPTGTMSESGAPEFAASKHATSEPAALNPATSIPVTPSSATSKPGASNPVTSTPATSNPAVSSSAASTSFTSAPATSNPVASTPATPQPTISFEEVTRKWLTAKRLFVKESTYVHYAVLAEKHLLPELGSLPLCELDSITLEDFITQKLKSGGLYENRALAPATVSNLKVILMQILKYARKRGLLDSVPECPAVPSSQPQIQVLTVEEQENLLKQALIEDTAFILGVLIALYAGLRIGEVCALQWKDFDFEAGTVTVRKTVMRIYNMNENAAAKTKAFVDTPKTVCSSRTIPLVDDIAHFFFARKKEDGVYVVTASEKFMEPRVCLDRYKRLLRRAGLKDYNFHLLRHTFATRCVEKGVDYKSLSEFLGHSDVSITMQRYVHPSMELKKKQINKLTGFGTRDQD